MTRGSLIAIPCIAAERRHQQVVGWRLYGIVLVILPRRIACGVVSFGAEVPVDYAAYLWDGGID